MESSTGNRTTTSGKSRIGEAQTTDHTQAMVELTTYVELLWRVKGWWQDAEPEDRRMLAHTLLDELVYDLDARRIVDFKIRSWAEPILVLRAGG